jgi:hypothetical protein
MNSPTLDVQFLSSFLRLVCGSQYRSRAPDHLMIFYFDVQFLSAFLLLVCGSLVSLVLLACEHGYVR